MIEEMEPAWQSSEGRLAENAEELARSQNALADCQEMLEELQSFSERQQIEIAALEARLQVPIPRTSPRPSKL